MATGRTMPNEILVRPVHPFRGADPVPSPTIAIPRASQKGRTMTRLLFAAVLAAATSLSAQAGEITGAWIATVSE